MKRYLEDSVENMRDIGGYKTEDSQVSYNKIFRSNLPQRLNLAKMFQALSFHNLSL